MANGLQDLVQQLTFSKLGKMLEGFGQQGPQQGNPFGQQQNQMQQMQPQEQQNIQPQQFMPSEEEAIEMPRMKSRKELNVQPKESSEDRKERFARQKEINKETLGYVQETEKAAEGAKDNNKRLKRMEKLIDSGRLNNRTWLEFVKRLENVGETNVANASGHGLGDIIAKIISPVTGTVGKGLRAATITPETEEFDKLSTDFLKSAKSVFGSRLTNFDVESYLKTIPTLALSDAGKKSIIRNLELFNEASLLKQKASRDIIKAHGGIRPYNLAELVDDQISDELDAITDEFINRPTQTPQEFHQIQRFANPMGNRK